jgi:hypothetical protein
VLDSPMTSGGESGIRTHVTGEPVNRISSASDAACRGRRTYDSARQELPDDPRKRFARGLDGVRPTPPLAGSRGLVRSAILIVGGV